MCNNFLFYCQGKSLSRISIKGPFFFTTYNVTAKKNNKTSFSKTFLLQSATPVLIHVTAYVTDCHVYPPDVTGLLAFLKIHSVHEWGSSADTWSNSCFVSAKDSACIKCVK